MQNTKKIIIGNWKMNPASAAEAKKIISGVKKAAAGLSKIEVVVCPPTLYALEASKLLAKDKKVRLGMQDISFAEGTGSQTGFISGLMAANAGAFATIIGHSERRMQGETDEIVNKKVLAAEKAGLRMVLCVGEQSRSTDGQYLEVIKQQIMIALAKLQKKSFESVVIAYEPAWAIGAKEAMSPQDIHEMSLYIKKILIEIAGKEIGADVPVLYGGSVNPTNAESIIYDGEVQGLLVGRDSLVPDNFGQIMKVANQGKKK